MDDVEQQKVQRISHEKWASATIGDAKQLAASAHVCSNNGGGLIPAQLELKQADPKRKGGSSFAQATFNCTSLLLGLGILSSPYAIAQAGGGGAVVSVAVAAMFAYAAHLMMRCQQETGGATYQDLAASALGKRASALVEAFFYVELVGSLVGYCISISDNLSVAFHGTGVGLSSNALLAIASAIILPTVWMRNLSALSFTSVWSVASSVGLILAVALAASPIDANIGLRHHIPLVVPSRLPLAAGLFAFAYSGTTVFPSVYASMANPAAFPRVLFLSFAMTTAAVTGLGLLGSLMFGHNTASQITLSMPPHRMTTKIVVWMTILTPLLKFALVLSPVSVALDDFLLRRFRAAPPKAHLAASLVGRSILMTLIVAAAIALPFFNYVVALIGSAVSISICLIFPCVFYMKLCRRHLTPLSVAALLLVSIFGAIAAVFGTIISFRGLVESKRGAHA